MWTASILFGTIFVKHIVLVLVLVIVLGLVLPIDCDAEILAHFADYEHEHEVPGWIRCQNRVPARHECLGYRRCKKQLREVLLAPAAVLEFYRHRRG